MAYTIKQIEDAAVALLAPLHTSLGVRTIKTYQGDLEVAAIEEFVKRVTAQAPAIYVTYGGSGYKSHGARKVETQQVLLIVVDKSLRDEADARRGGANNPGTYAMLAGARDALTGQQWLADLWPAEIIHEAPIWSGDGIAIYGAMYETSQGHIYPAA